MTEQDIKTLSNYKEFSNLLYFVIQEREACIAALFDAPQDKVLQISGQILAYDQLIKTTDAHRVVRRHEQ